MTTSLLQSRVLVLNKVYLPIHVISVKRAFCMVYRGAAKFVDEQYKTFDFVSWSELSVANGDEAIGMVGRMIRIPRVILLQTYDRMPKKQVRFSRFNIYARDKNTCQYCQKKFSKSELNLDHVIPRTKGGATTWENVVCCCVPCNRKKGGRTPREAGMKLMRKPIRPHWTECLNLSLRHPRYREWLPFLNIVDFSYWNVELEE